MPSEDSFAALFQQESNNFWFCARNELIIWAIQKFAANARSFLEIGCGTGFVLKGINKALPNLRIVASEIYQKGLTFAQQRVPSSELIQMDARKIPYIDEFDLIGAFDVLEHIENDQDVLNEMFKAVSKSPGSIIITVPQHKFLWSYADTYARHVRRYTAEELLKKVELAGFKPTFKTSFVSLLLPALMVSRACAADSEEKYDPSGEFKISPIANGALRLIMDLERSLIKLGARPQLGGSLLVVARTQ